MTQQTNAWFVIVLHGDKEHPQIHYGDVPERKKPDSPKKRFLGNPVRIAPEHIQDHHMNLTKLNEIYRTKLIAS